MRYIRAMALRSEFRAGNTAAEHLRRFQGNNLNRALHFWGPRVQVRGALVSLRAWGSISMNITFLRALSSKLMNDDHDISNFWVVQGAFKRKVQGTLRQRQGKLEATFRVRQDSRFGPQGVSRHRDLSLYLKPPDMSTCRRALDRQGWSEDNVSECKVARNKKAKR